MTSIVQTDLRNILRDPSLLVICFVPLLMLALVYWGYPVLLASWTDAELYAIPILAMFCISGALMPGMAMAFSILDEKDNNITAVLKILPISYQKIILYRIVTIYIFGFFTAWLLVSFSGIEVGNVFQNIALSLLTAAIAPLMALIPAFFAANKIEGATFTKGLNFIAILPIVAFLFPGNWGNLLMIFPAWWIYFAFESTGQPAMLLLAVSAGLMYHVAIIFVLVKIILRRMLYQG